MLKRVQHDMESIILNAHAILNFSGSHTNAIHYGNRPEMDNRQNRR